MTAGLLAALALLPAAAPGVAVTPDDLAFVLGRAHGLRQLCVGRDDAAWRDRMSDLLTAERAERGRRDQLVRRFNAGFAEANAGFRTCDDAARAALRETAAQGAADALALAQAAR